MTKIPKDLYFPLNVNWDARNNKNKTVIPNNSISLSKWLNKYLEENGIGSGGGSSNIFENGITETFGNVKLGGILIEDTTIDLDDFTLNMIGTQSLINEEIYFSNGSKIWTQTGANLFDFKTLFGLPNGIDGLGTLYLENPDNFTSTNGAKLIFGNLSDFGISGSGTAFILGLGAINRSIAETFIQSRNNAVSGEARTDVSVKGYGDISNPAFTNITIKAQNQVSLDNTSIIFELLGQNGNKQLLLKEGNWGVYDNTVGSGYNFPWVDGSNGEVLVTDGHGNTTWQNLNNFTSEFVNNGSVTYYDLPTSAEVGNLAYKFTVEFVGNETFILRTTDGISTIKSEQKSDTEYILDYGINKAYSGETNNRNITLVGIPNQSFLGGVEWVIVSRTSYNINSFSINLHKYSTVDRDFVFDPITGLQKQQTGTVIYNTDLNKIQFYNGSIWETVGEELLPTYTDDTDAGANGLVAGQRYQTNGTGAAPLNVAGIVMVKQ